MLSRWGNENDEGQDGTYICDEGRKRKPLVSRKGPRLPRYSGHGANAGRGDIDDENGGHNRCTDITLGGVEEDLDKGIACGSRYNVIDAAQSEAKANNHHEPQGTINARSPHNSFW